MKTPLLSVLFATLALAGCDGSHSSVHEPAEPAPASAYKAGHGVKLTDAALAFTGLRTAEVDTHAFDGAESPAVPQDALLRTVRGDFVYVANGDWFLRTPVTTGAADATHVEIRDGLYEGDTIVVQGLRPLALAEIQALNGGVGCADGH